MEGEKRGKHQEINQEHKLPKYLIIYEILVRLPVISLLRFKTVCKEWNSIILSPEFAKMHLNISKKRASIIYSLFIDIGDLSYMFNDYISGDKLRFIGSCNGLLCFHVTESYILPPSFLCVWNPSIHKFCRIVLPSNKSRKTFSTLENGGFGYVSSLDDYKIVVTGYDSIATQHVKRWAFVYSFRANTWTELPQLAECDVVIASKRKGALVNEMLYWGHGEKLIGFRLEDHTIHEVPTCQGVNIVTTDLASYSVTCALGGSPCACDSDVASARTVELRRFEHHECSASWMKLLKFDDGNSLGVKIEDFIGFTQPGKILLYTANRGVFVVDVKGNPPNFLISKQGMVTSTSVVSVASFTESLVSPYYYLSETNSKGKGKARNEELKQGCLCCGL